MSLLNDFSSRRDAEERMREQGRLPPGQSLTQKFPVLHYGPVPDFNPAQWDFRIWGEVAEMRWTWEEFNQLPRRTVTMDVHCVTRWSKFDTTWEGISVRTLVDRGLIQLRSTANYVVQHAEYSFTVNLPIEVVLSDNFLLATHFNGAPLEVEHGYPLRAVVGAIPSRPDLAVPYFWKGAKWLRGLEFLEHDRPGFWEMAGYHNQADVWREERFGRG